MLGALVMLTAAMTNSAPAPSQGSLLLGAVIGAAHVLAVMVRFRRTAPWKRDRPERLHVRLRQPALCKPASCSVDSFHRPSNCRYQGKTSAASGCILGALPAMDNEPWLGYTWHLVRIWPCGAGAAIAEPQQSINQDRRSTPSYSDDWRLAISVADCWCRAGGRIQSAAVSYRATADVVAARSALGAVVGRDISSPLLGLGPMHFATLGSEVGAHPHNWPLQIASEWGLPALALLAFALVWSVVRASDSMGLSSDFSIAALLAAAVALVYGLVDGIFVMPVSQTASALVLGFWLGSTMPTVHDTPPRRSINSVFIGAVTTVAIASVCGYALWSYGDQARSISAFRAKHPAAWLTPRFWDQGQLLDLRW